MLAQTIIPKIVHQTFANERDLSQEIILKNKILEELNPDYTFEYYDNERMIEWVWNNSTEAQFEIFTRINPIYGAARADFFRYLLMYRVGGVYLDIKSTSIVPLSDIIRPKDELLISKWEINSNSGSRIFGKHKELLRLNVDEFQQWFLISKPNHPVFSAVLDYVSEQIAQSSQIRKSKFGRLGVLELTGPIAFTKVVNEFLNHKSLRVIDSYKEGFRYKTLINNRELGYTNTLVVHYSRLFEPIVMHKFKIVDRLLTYLNFFFVQWFQFLDFRFFLLRRKLFRKLNRILLPWSRY